MSVAFLVTSLVVVATPGTGALYTIATGLQRGRRASAIAAAGCTLGIVPHLLAAVSGLAAVLHASASAFSVIKYAGVAYLLFLAWQTWRDKTPFETEQSEAPPSAGRVIRQAVLINILNPKLTIFFFVFLPQFVRPDQPSAMQHMLALSAVFMLLTFAVFACYGCSPPPCAHTSWNDLGSSPGCVAPSPAATTRSPVGSPCPSVDRRGGSHTARRADARPGSAVTQQTGRVLPVRHVAVAVPAQQSPTVEVVGVGRRSGWAVWGCPCRLGSLVAEDR